MPEACGENAGTPPAVHFQAFCAKAPHPTRQMDATTAYALDVRDLGEFLSMVNAGTIPPRLAGVALFEGGKKA